MRHKRALVLNADYTPIQLYVWQQAVHADIKNVVKVLITYHNDFIKATGGIEWPVPAVVCLREYKKQDKRKIPFSRKNVFIRDELRCQYCRKKFSPEKLTFDHIVPRALWDKKNGSPTVWTNIVTCCYPCNHKKGSMTLKEAKMELIRQPKQPSKHNFVLGLAPWSRIEPEWEPYLPAIYRDLCCENK